MLLKILRGHDTTGTAAPGAGSRNLPAFQSSFNTHPDGAEAAPRPAAAPPALPLRAAPTPCRQALWAQERPAATPTAPGHGAEGGCGPVNSLTGPRIQTFPGRTNSPEGLKNNPKTCPALAKQLMLKLSPNLDPIKFKRLATPFQGCRPPPPPRSKPGPQEAALRPDRKRWPRDPNPPGKGRADLPAKNLPL